MFLQREAESKEKVLHKKCEKRMMVSAIYSPSCRWIGIRYIHIDKTAVATGDTYSLPFL